MYSPFHNEQGQPKDLAEVTYADLSQLADLDEGFVLEFKRTWNENVRKKIPKIIASFANSRGGWLIIGIADDDKSLCPIPKISADFSQIFGELCRHHVSPTPRFDARFIPDPANPDQGVVVVQVHEGDFPPYVADGIVEIREGSTSGPALGSALVELYHKATKRTQEIREYCKRTVWYAQDSIPSATIPRDACSTLASDTEPDSLLTPERTAGGTPNDTSVAQTSATYTTNNTNIFTLTNQTNLPLFDLYLFRMGSRANKSTSREVINSHVQAMRAAFTHQNMECHVQHAHDSLIFRTSIALPGGSVHSAIELFTDESMKLTVPAIMLEAADRERALAELQKDGITIAPGARFIGATRTLKRVTRMASLLDRYVRERGLSWTSYAVAYELENMAGVMLWSHKETYRRYIRNHGLLYCSTTDGCSRIRYLDDGEHDSFRARQFAGSHFFEACGLPLGSPDPEDNELVDALLRDGKLYRPEKE